MIYGGFLFFARCRLTSSPSWKIPSPPRAFQRDGRIQFRAGGNTVLARFLRHPGVGAPLDRTSKEKKAMSMTEYCRQMLSNICSSDS